MPQCERVFVSHTKLGRQQYSSALRKAASSATLERVEGAAIAKSTSRLPTENRCFVVLWVCEGRVARPLFEPDRCV